MIGTTLAGCAAFIIMAMAAIVLSTLLIIGPIFVCLLLFEATSRWFWSWLSNLFSFALMQILLFALLTVASGITANLYKRNWQGLAPDCPAAIKVEFICYNNILIQLPTSNLTVDIGVLSFIMK
ncbi:MAG: type IV secretion system protein [Rhodospirillaceae bacterium]|nr:type IV secretion system protein [Rhodospirillaceae bacterium]